MPYEMPFQQSFYLLFTYSLSAVFSSILYCLAITQVGQKRKPSLFSSHFSVKRDVVQRKHLISRTWINTSKYYTLVSYSNPTEN